MRGLIGKSIADVRAAVGGGDDGEDEQIYLEDDVELEALAATKTEAQLREEQAEAEAKGR